MPHSFETSCPIDQMRDSERGHLVGGNSFGDDRVGEETRLDVRLDVSEPVLRRNVEFGRLALFDAAVTEAYDIMTVRYGDPDGIGIGEMAQRNIIKIYAESDCHSKRRAHTVELDDSVLGKDERVVALFAGRAAPLNVHDCSA